MRAMWSVRGSAPRARCLVWLVVAAGCGSSPGVTNDAAGTGGGAGGASGLGGAGGAGVDGGLGGASAGGGGRGGSGGRGGAQGGTGGTGVPPRPCAHEIDNPSCWSARDLTDFTDIAQSFTGAIFDGRYVTFVNGTSAPPQAQVR